MILFRLHGARPVQYHGLTMLQYGELDTKTRIMTILASNIASQAQTGYRMMLEGALRAGVTPVEIKEILYQAEIGRAHV